MPPQESGGPKNVPKHVQRTLGTLRTRDAVRLARVKQVVGKKKWSVCDGSRRYGGGQERLFFRLESRFPLFLLILGPRVPHSSERVDDEAGEVEGVERHAAEDEETEGLHVTRNGAEIWSNWVKLGQTGSTNGIGNQVEELKEIGNERRGTRNGRR